MNFSKWWIFFNSLLFFWQNSVFENISWFCDQTSQIIFSSESSSDKNANRCKTLVCSSSGKTNFQKQADVYFCYWLYVMPRTWLNMYLKNLVLYGIWNTYAYFGRILAKNFDRFFLSLADWKAIFWNSSNYCHKFVSGNINKYQFANSAKSFLVSRSILWHY